jgi:hypothetical protein
LLALLFQRFMLPDNDAAVIDRMGKIAHIPCALTDRNSQRTGNLTGNLQNSAEFALFGLPA